MPKSSQIQESLIRYRRFWISGNTDILSDSISQAGQAGGNNVGRIGRGWQLTKLSFSVIRQDKELLLFPLISGIMIIAIAASFIVPWFMLGTFTGNIDIAFIVFWIVFYFVSFFVSTFFNVALMGCTMKRLDGGDPTFGYGIIFAAERIKYIVEWALVAATIGLILKALEERAGSLGKIVVGLIGIAWAITSYFAVPAMAFEKLSPLKALKRGASILKTTWGEVIISNLGVGIIFFILALLGILIMPLGFALGGITGGIITMVIAVVYWIIIGLVSTAVSGVLHTALYRYAITGKTTAHFPTSALQNPWSLS